MTDEERLAEIEALHVSPTSPVSGPYGRAEMLQWVIDYAHRLTAERDAALADAAAAKEGR